MTNEAMITAGVAISFLLVRAPMWSLVWLLLALFWIPSEQLGVAGFSVFMVHIITKIMKAK